MSNVTRTPQERLERTARRRAGAKMGWYIHATVFVVVNLLVALIAAAAGRDWIVYPSMGWAVALAIHGVVVFFVTGGAGLHERLVQRERARLQLQRDPW
ncbi:MAG: 2TM domain-containing protein [Ramlibacter sp.]